MKEELLNEKQAAVVVGMSIHWLRRKRWEGGGPRFCKLGSGSRAAVRYIAADLTDFINSHRKSSTSEYGTA